MYIINVQASRFTEYEIAQLWIAFKVGGSLYSVNQVSLHTINQTTLKGSLTRINRVKKGYQSIDISLSLSPWIFFIFIFLPEF
jgi:hypothetical protein